MTMAGWATLAGERADRLKDEVDKLASRSIADGRIDDLRRRLKAVRRDHIDARHGPVEWLAGNAVNESWSELHRIEEQVEELKDTRVVVEDADRHVRLELPKKRAGDLKSKLHSAEVVDQKRVALDAIREAHWAVEDRYESQRNQRRGMLGIAAGLMVAAVLMILVQAFAVGDERLIPAPGDGTAIRPWALLTLVMLFGMLGGAISALLSLYVTSKKFTSTLWFDPRPGLTLVKVCVGLWTAVIGVLAVGTGLVVGVYTTVASILLLAFIFGYAQQAITTFIDRKVVGMLDVETA